MDSTLLHSLRAFLAAGVVAIAPQTALGDLSAVDLSDLRRALSEVEGELRQGVERPVDVAAIWARLPLVKGMVDVPKMSDVPGVLPVAPAAAVSLFGTPDEAEAPAAPKPAMFGQGVLAPPAAPLHRKTADDTPRLGQLGAGPAQAKRAPQDVGTTNFRLMLAGLAQTFTGQNNQAVVNAQGPRGPVALSVRAGVVTLADVQAFSAAQGHPPRADGTLTLPVVIWPDATLRLSPGERLALARDTGAFVLSMGTLDVEGAVIEVAGAENPHTPSFIPFVTVTGGGSAQIRDATLRGLGFGQTAKFSGLSVAGNLLTQGKGKVVIRDTLFDGLKVVSLAGVAGAEVSGNTFVNARHNTLNLVSAPRARIDGNLFGGDAPTNAIRVDRGSGYTEISDNIFLSGQRVAVLVDGASDHVQVRDNLVWRRAGAGVKFLRSACGLAQGNVILDNKQKGVEVRKSDGTVVRDNLIVGNGSAGIWVSAQQADARTSVSGNILRANGSGLSAATGAEIQLRGNDMRAQLPRLLDGDIARLTNTLVADLRGSMMLRFKDGQADAGGRFAALCGSDL